MYLRIDDFEINPDYLDYVITELGGFITFAGKAPEEIGKEIHDHLKQHKVGDTVRFKAIDSDGNQLSGIAEIKELRLSMETPTIYLFRGRMRKI